MEGSSPAPVPPTPHDSTEPIHHRSSPESEREIAYTEETKAFVRSHPGFLAAVKKAVDLNEESLPSRPFSRDGKYDDGEIEVETLGTHPEFQKEKRFHRHYYRVRTADGEGDFFLKVTHWPKQWSPTKGAQELLVAGEIERALKDFSGDFKVAVVDYSLGYTEKDVLEDMGHGERYVKYGKSYFLAKYNQALELPFVDWLKRAEREISSLGEVARFNHPGFEKSQVVAKAKLDLLSQRLQLLKQRHENLANFLKSKNYIDVDRNISYDEVADTFIVFDVVKERGTEKVSLGNPA